MSNTPLTGVLLLLLVKSGGAAQIGDKRWVEAEHNIRRVAPRIFRQLPQPVSDYFQRYNYAVPQSYDGTGLHNVLRGHFDSDTAEDWAVLASRDGYSQILVFWRGLAKRVTKINRGPDAAYLRMVGGNEIGYSRRISVVRRAYILDHYRAYGGPKPPRIQHDAIDDCFSGKASRVYYFDGRRWRSLQGAD